MIPDISDDSDDTPLLKKIKASASSKSREHSRKRVRSVVSDDVSIRIIRTLLFGTLTNLIQLEDDSERPPKQTKNDALSSIIPVIHATSELSVRNFYMLVAYTLTQTNRQFKYNQMYQN